MKKDKDGWLIATEEENETYKKMPLEIAKDLDVARFCHWLKVQPEGSTQQKAAATMMAQWILGV